MWIQNTKIVNFAQIYKFLCVKKPIGDRFLNLFITKKIKIYRWFWKRSVFLLLLQCKFKFCFKLWLTSTFTSFWVHNSRFLIDRLSFRFSRNSAEIRVCCFMALELELHSDFCLPSLLFFFCLLLEEQCPIALNESKLKKFWKNFLCV